jgi:glycosyltransferase involved in cell wall biosynthesis
MHIAWISKIEWNMPHKTSRLKLSEALIKRGHNVTLYMVKKFGEKSFNTNYCVNIPTIHFPILSGFFYGLTVFFYFPILLNRKKVDIIIIDGTKIWLPFIIPLKILNIPIILDIRTLPIDRDKSFFFNVTMYLSRYIVDGITTITPELKNIIKDRYNLRNIKIGIWSSGVSVNDFKNVDLINQNFGEKKFTLIYHGDYSPTRGIENLINAISQIDPLLKNKIKLMIIGMPQSKIKDLSKLAENIGVKDQIDLLPKIEYKKIAQYINIADVGVIPLPPENRWWQVSAPLKTLEYLAAGKPIIATNIPFHVNIFKKGNYGILLESGSPEIIAKGITDLYKNKNDLKKIGEEGRKIVEKFYSWDVMAREVENFLNTVIN